MRRLCSLPAVALATTGVLLGGVLLGGLTAGASARPVAAPATVSATSASLASRDAAFAGRLLAGLAKSASAQPGGNIAVSPLSVAQVLQMLYIGARGQTASQLATLLGVTGLTPAEVSAASATLTGELSSLTTGTSPVLSIANSLWLQTGLPVAAAYKKQLASGFAAELETVNFGNPTEAADRINDWVSTHTHGYIPTLLTPQDLVQAVMVVVNAIYLKDSWTHPFAASGTVKAPFHLANGATVSAETMHQTTTYGYRKTATYQAIRLSYTGGRLAMTILLPTGSLAGLDAGLASKGLAPYLTGLTNRSVTLAIPKFTLTDSTDLNHLLTTLGMTDAFSSAANFSGISAKVSQLSLVQTKTYLKVAEKGTVAAAATGGVGIATAVEQAQAVVAVNHPFVFVISDLRTGLPLFAGQVSNPTVGG